MAVPQSSPAPNREQRRHGDQLDGRLLTAAELAERYGICRATVYNLLAQGLPSIKVGRARRFDVARTDAWLEAQQTPDAA